MYPSVCLTLWTFCGYFSGPNSTVLGWYGLTWSASADGSSSVGSVTGSTAQLHGPIWVCSYRASDRAVGFSHTHKRIKTGVSIPCRAFACAFRGSVAQLHGPICPCSHFFLGLKHLLYLPVFATNVQSRTKVASRVQNN